MVKKFAQSELLTSALVSVTLNFQGMSRGHKEKHPDDIVLSKQLVLVETEGKYAIKGFGPEQKLNIGLKFKIYSDFT